MAYNTRNHPSEPNPYSYPPSVGGKTPGSEYPPYSSTDAFNAPEFRSTGREEAIPGGRTAGTEGEYSGYEKGVNPVTRGSIAAQMAAEGQIPKKEGLRMWRTDEHKGTFTKGGRGRCCGRVCCCAIILVLLILVSVIASFFLWVKPPEISFNGVEPPSSGNQVSVQNAGFALNVRLNIGVINPNFFGVKFEKIAATAFYPLKPTTSVGGGSLDDVNILKYSNTTIRFPFTVNYTTSYDSDLSVLNDIAAKCGVSTAGGATAAGTGAQSDLTFNYKLVLSLKIAAIKISPSFSSSASFACPLSAQDIQNVLGDSGLSTAGSSRLRERAEWADERRRAYNDMMAKLIQRGFNTLADGQGTWN